jgi:glucose-1-phosphate adenylyltransferase
MQHFETHSSRKSYADANRVSAIILGGGIGAQLFPLTSTRATPAVRDNVERPTLITLL